MVNSDLQKCLLIGDCSSRKEHEFSHIKDGDKDLLVRLQLAEEVAARQAAQLAVEGKKRKKMEIMNMGLEMEVNIQHELLQQNFRPLSEVGRLEAGGVSNWQ